MATDPKIDAINSEIAKMRDEIKVRQKRLDDLIKLKLLTTTYYDIFDAGPRKVGRSVERVQRKLKLSRFTTKREAIIETSKEILADAKRRFARELLVELDKRGITVGGKDPKSNLSSYLSHDDAFEADTKLGGWTLRSLLPPKAKASSVTALPAFKSSNGSTNGASQGTTYVARSSP